LSGKVLVVCLLSWIHLTEKSLQLIIIILSYRSFEIMCYSNTYRFLTGTVTIKLQYSIKLCHVTISEELPSASAGYAVFSRLCCVWKDMLYVAGYAACSRICYMKQVLTQCWSLSTKIPKYCGWACCV
jgi:hypothetical protein